jgi:hypothetical protein
VGLGTVTLWKHQELAVSVGPDSALLLKVWDDCEQSTGGYLDMIAR